MPIELSRILKAAAVLSGFTVERLALDTGIRLSRVSRILQGATAPTGDEALKLFASALKRDRRGTLLTAADLTAADLAQALRDLSEAAGNSALLSLISLLPASPSEPIADDDCILAIDKLSFTFWTDGSPRWLREVEERCIPRPSRLYGLAFHYLDVRIESRPTFRTDRPYRVEFNPRALWDERSKARRLLHSIMASVDSSSSQITRIDLALDVPVSIRDVQGFGERQRKLNQWIGPSGLETIYSGGKKAALQLKVYDKRRERAERGATPCAASPLTRFEAQIRRPGLRLDELARLKNPFTGLRVFLLRPDGLPLERRLLIGYARIMGVLALKGELAPEQFKTLLRHLELSDKTPLIPHPRELFTARWPAIAASLLSALRIGRAP